MNGLTLGFADLTEDDQPVQREDFGQTPLMTYRKALT